VTGYERVFDWTEYEQLAQTMRTMQGKMMLNINDHPIFALCLPSLILQNCS
ncbi:putative phage associated type II DNA-methyltransferase, partial [Kingella kingae PYKK081]